MAKQRGTSEPQIRLQIVLCEEVAKEVERHAGELDRSQAWIIGWGIRNTLRHKDLFLSFLSKRVYRAKDCQKWKPGGTESRLQLKIDKSVVDELELIATALNQSPLKLAGLMVEHALEKFSPSLFLMKTTAGKIIRRLAQGPEDFQNYDATDEARDQSGNLESKEG